MYEVGPIASKEWNCPTSILEMTAHANVSRPEKEK